MEEEEEVAGARELADNQGFGEGWWQHPRGTGLQAPHSLAACPLLVELVIIEGTAVTPQEAPGSVVKVLGLPYLELPKDLYIPPEALEVFLETFEGPLDLLLYLIRKHNLDVLDIPMAEITRQYMVYVDVMRFQQLELAAEYLLMAALLIEIKSRMLLPRPPVAGEDDDTDDPRARLVLRLLEYERMKLAAQGVNALPALGRDFVAAKVLATPVEVIRLPDVDPEDLRVAWLTLLSRARADRHHRVTREQLSVREHMSRVLRHLRELPIAEFTQLFSRDQGVPEVVVTFLAILELARERLVVLVQQVAAAPIYVRLNHGLSAD